MPDHPTAPAKRALGLAVAAAVLGAGSLFYRRLLPGPAPAPAERPRPGAPFSLVEDSARAGLVFKNEEFVPAPALANVAPWLGSIGAGVAVADVDGDGRPDVFVTNNRLGSKSALFMNQGNGTFKDEAARAGLADVSEGEAALRPLFFDWDNDGRPDLLLTTTWCARAFHNEGGGRFREVPDAAGIHFCGYAVASAAIDYDGDGLLDVVIAGYFPPVRFTHPRSTRVMQESNTNADNGGEIAVFHNDGGGRFHRAPGDLGLKGGRWTLAIGVWDFDGDGRPDLYLATDYSQDRAYLNLGGGRLRDVSSTLASQYSRHGMNADFADVEGDGRTSVFVTHVYEPPYQFGLNTLWTFRQDGSGFTERPDALGAGNCGWAWGAKFVDLDLDGRPDLAVTAGYISADPKKSYWYDIANIMQSDSLVIADARNWPPMAGYSLAGYEPKCVFRNIGGRFLPVSVEAGVAGDLSDGRAVAVIEARGDGRQDLVFVNQGQPLRYYRDVPPPENGWIGFRLRGTRSNRDAWGSKVTVRLPGRTLTRQLQPANGFMSQSDPQLVFGLGPSPRVLDVRVRWPAGADQDLGPLSPGRRYDLTEPR
ncbi:MAG: CRTAC1 family protein [Elusimicrobia bacterium]|nr:CRTAC1 family protein [Elusimicrobiota bacterium]